jgi:CHASE3 domain sensor protein
MRAAMQRENLSRIRVAARKARQAAKDARAEARPRLEGELVERQRANRTNDSLFVIAALLALILLAVLVVSTR